jgi:hypothetical protein
LLVLLLLLFTPIVAASQWNAYFGKHQQVNQGFLCAGRSLDIRGLP